tara:strand:- start:1887 stop:2819 length:933 start_codon:yes stop_codon:yes gene_type:complete
MSIIKTRRIFFALSAVLLLISVVSLIMPPSLNPGIDFSSGSTLEVRFTKQVNEDSIRDKLASLGHQNAMIQSMGQNEFFIRLKSQESGQTLDRGLMLDALQEIAMIDSSNFDSVSPIIAIETVRNATIAVVVAAIGILLYITWVFRAVSHPFRYGVSAIIALIHDVVIILGVFSVLGKITGLEVNAMFIVGILTVIGYSVNDTIVVFDRLRENLLIDSARSFEESVNVSILESIGRSLNTSITTLVVGFALLLFGGTTIRELVVVLIVGIISGTYSSIFVASHLLIAWEKRELAGLFSRIPFLGKRRSTL